MFPPSIISLILMCFLVPQNLSLTITSWDTSQSLLVKYPEFAVFKAVSAKPFRAPCVDVKYSKTVKPSLKFEIIGVSIISPDGFAIRPLIPANCFIWAAEPLAPESAIINIELVVIEPSSLLTFDAEIFFIISLAILSVHFDHWSTTLLYFSPLVIKPSEYCVSYSSTIFFASDIIFSFDSGITKSSFPKDIPALNALWKPIPINLSQKITVSFCPQYLKIISINSEICFFVNNLFTRSKEILWCLGSMSASKNLPTLVWYVLKTGLPFSSTVSNLDTILEWTLIDLFSRPCAISSKFRK